MLHLFLDDKPWFAPKRYGYGAGLPIAWQGWVVVAAHLVLVLGAGMALFPDLTASIVLSLMAALLPLPLYAVKTRGGWKWRKGDEAD